MRAVGPARRGSVVGDNRRMEQVDHLVYAAPELEAVGARGSAGRAGGGRGAHPNEGTRNYLMGLGPRVYLEIVGPDAEAGAPSRPRWFQIDTLVEPRLVAWAARVEGLDAVVANAAAGGVRLGAVAAGGRETAEGRRLSWRFTDPRVAAEGGVVPFLIDWGQTPHPALSAPRGAILEGLRAEHPEPERARRAVEILGLDLPVAIGRRSALIATIRTPRGEVIELR